MGRYHIEITAVGGHGCQRDTVKDGQAITDHCGQASCPDCKARAFVKDLQETGNSVESATLTHWPGQEGEVRDDLVSGLRAGSF